MIFSSETLRIRARRIIAWNIAEFTPVTRPAAAPSGYSSRNVSP